MSITYRTAGAWGAGKGANLTPAEVDGNFYALDGRMTDLEDNPPAANSISNITLSGNQLTIYLDDSTAFVFTLPTAEWIYRGEFTAAYGYSENDVFHAPGYGLYLVLQSHTAATPFDPDAGNTAGDYYQRILPPTSAAVVTVAGSGHQLQLENVGKYHRLTNGTCIVTIPANAEEAIPVNAEYHFRHAGSAGTMVFETSTGVTLNGIDGFDAASSTPGAVVTLKQVAADEWDLFGGPLDAVSA